MKSLKGFSLFMSILTLSLFLIDKADAKNGESVHLKKDIVSNRMENRQFAEALYSAVKNKNSNKIMNSCSVQKSDLAREFVCADIIFRITGNGKRICNVLSSMKGRRIYFLLDEIFTDENYTPLKYFNSTISDRIWSDLLILLDKDKKGVFKIIAGLAREADGEAAEDIGIKLSDLIYSRSETVWNNISILEKNIGDISIYVDFIKANIDDKCPLKEDPKCSRAYKVVSKLQK